MSRFLKDTKKYYKYAIYSAKSKLQSEVASSYLNWLWWVLDPICFMLIYTLIFGVVFNAKEQYFTVFIFIGLTMWDFFNKTLQQSVKIVKNNKSIVAKVYLPKYILVMVRMFVNGFKMLISFGIVIIMMVIYRVPVSFNILYMIPIMLTPVSVHVRMQYDRGTFWRICTGLVQRDQYRTASAVLYYRYFL